MTKKLTLLTIFLLASILLSSQTVIRQIRPSDTDPLITTFDTDSHYVYINTTVVAKNILVVHLPGSFGEPKRATLFGTLAAELGFHSIGLMYPNAPTVGSFCTNSVDTSCYENIRREIVEGVDYSSSISINSHECILNRVNKLLIYLNATFPSENWGQYLDANNNLVYSKIMFSGHSQGGGHAAIIGKYYPIKRVICFSSPKDWSNYYNTPPLWLSPTGWQTSPGSIYCFNHILDEQTRQLEIWDSLGIDNFGPPVLVDSSISPYSYTRQLTTAYTVPVGDEHGSTVQDNKTPKISGIPVFIPVWTYMLTDDLTSVLIEDDFNSRLQLVPNPTNNVVSIELSDDHYTIVLVDQTGRCVLQQQTETGKIQLDLNNLKTGIYFVRVIANQKVFTGKIVKQ